MRVVSDDSRQNPFSVRSVKEVQYKRIKEELPWLETVRGQSDQCGDYHSTQATVSMSQLGTSTGLYVTEFGHTEPGEGKNVVDMDCGQGKQDLARDRDTGHDHESGEEIFDGLERRPRPGCDNVLMEMDRANERQGKGDKKPPLPNISDYQHTTFNSDGSVACREAWGFGPGRLFSKDQLDTHDQHMLGASGTGAVAVKASELLVPKAQFSNSQRTLKSDERRRKTTEKSELSTKKRRTDKEAVAKEHGPDESHRCQCGHALLTAGAMQAHEVSGCGKAQKRRAARRKERPTLTQRMDRIVDAAESESALERRELALVTVKLPRETGLSFKRGDGLSIIVDGVSGAAAESLVVAGGYILRSVDSTAAALASANATVDETVRAALAVVGETVTFVFERPSPPLPPHGWARKALRREPKSRFTEEQKGFLDKHFASSLKGGERMRDKKVYKLMKEEFGRRLGKDEHSLVLSQAQIRGYFSRRAASLKRAAVDASLRGDDAAADAAADADDAADEGGGENDDEYEGFKVAELQEILRARELAVSGVKAVLIARLRADDTGEDSEPENTPAPKRRRR
jgi:hypothetical protein